MTVERYSHVMHIVSNVVGELADEDDRLRRARRRLPGRHRLGAPKIRAMEIIDELERHRRGPYAGCGRLLRLLRQPRHLHHHPHLVFVDGMAYCQAGAGVVADSVPELEERETEAKARVLLTAVAAAEALSAAGPPDGYRPVPARTGG